jgi:hypothetical protein
VRSRRASFRRRHDLLLDEGRSSEHHRAPDATPTDDRTRGHTRVLAVAGDRHVPALPEQRCNPNSKLYRSEPCCFLRLNGRFDHDNRGRHGSGHSPGSGHNGGPSDNNRSATGTDHHNNNPATRHHDSGTDRQRHNLAESVGPPRRLRNWRKLGSEYGQRIRRRTSVRSQLLVVDLARLRRRGIRRSPVGSDTRATDRDRRASSRSFRLERVARVLVALSQTKRSGECPILRSSS